MPDDRDTASTSSAYSPELTSSNVSTVPRVKAKVSSLAKTESSSPNLPSVRAESLRTRSPSAGPALSMRSTPPHPPEPFYPITTATPAANPHRYAPARPSPPAFADSRHTNHNWQPQYGMIDPASIPLPATSPPSSTLSFSSRSSASRSSVSYATDSERDSPVIASTPLNNIGNGAMTGTSLRNVLDNLVQFNDYGDEHLSPTSTGGRGYEHRHKSEEHKIKAEAKSNRKVFQSVTVMEFPMTDSIADCGFGNHEQISSSHQRVVGIDETSSGERDTRFEAQVARVPANTPASCLPCCEVVSGSRRYGRRRRRR